MKQFCKFALFGLLAVFSGAQVTWAASSSNMAEGKTVKFLVPPNDETVSDPDDAKQLVDGVLSLATPMWYDKADRAPVGWVGTKPVEFVVDLDKPEPIKGVLLHVGAGVFGVAWPSHIYVSVSDDGKAYAQVADLMKTTHEKPRPDTYESLWLGAESLKTHGRYVKFAVVLPNAEKGGYFYTDELQVLRGDEAWLKLPLTDAKPDGNANSPRPALKNLAAGIPVKFDTTPNDPSVADDGDDKQLTDGVISSMSPIWKDQNIVGWIGSNPAVFTIDLGRVQPVQGVALHMAAGYAGVEWPTSIQVEASEDGNKYVDMGDVMEALGDRPSGDAYSEQWLVADRMAAKARFVRFTIVPVSKSDAFTYIDELEIYAPGDASPVKSP